MIRSMLMALRSLSVLPVGDDQGSIEGREGEVLAFYPLAGLAVGVLPALASILMIQPPLPEALAVLVLAGVTGLRHLCQLGRTTEALVCGRPALGALEVMREPKAGVAGAAAVTLVLLVKFAALMSLRVELSGISSRLTFGATAGLLLAVLLATSIARWAAVMVACYSDYARPEGGPDEPLIAGVGPRETRWALAATVSCTMLLCLLGWVGGLGLSRGLIALFGCSAFAWMAAAWFTRRFNGSTGECLGAVIETCEALALVLMCLIPSSFNDRVMPGREIASPAVASSGQSDSRSGEDGSRRQGQVPTGTLRPVRK